MREPYFEPGVTDILAAVNFPRELHPV